MIRTHSGCLLHNWHFPTDHTYSYLDRPFVKSQLLLRHTQMGSACHWTGTGTGTDVRKGAKEGTLPTVEIKCRAE